MVVDSENNRLYHKQLRRKIKEMSENKETSSPTFHLILSVDFVSFRCWWTAATLSFSSIPAEIYWAESHIQQTGVDLVVSVSWWTLGTVVFMGWDVQWEMQLAMTNDNWYFCSLYKVENMSLMKNGS